MYKPEKIRNDGTAQIINMALAGATEDTKQLSFSNLDFAGVLPEEINWPESDAAPELVFNNCNWAHFDFPDEIKVKFNDCNLIGATFDAQRNYWSSVEMHDCATDLIIFNDSYYGNIHIYDDHGFEDNIAMIINDGMSEKLASMDALHALTASFKEKNKEHNEVGFMKLSNFEITEDLHDMIFTECAFNDNVTAVNRHFKNITFNNCEFNYGGLKNCTFEDCTFNGCTIDDTWPAFSFEGSAFVGETRFVRMNETLTDSHSFTKASIGPNVTGLDVISPGNEYKLIDENGQEIPHSVYLDPSLLEGLTEEEQKQLFIEKAIETTKLHEVMTSNRFTIEDTALIKDNIGRCYDEILADPNTTEEEFANAEKSRATVMDFLDGLEKKLYEVKGNVEKHEGISDAYVLEATLPEEREKRILEKLKATPEGKRYVRTVIDLKATSAFAIESAKFGIQNSIRKLPMFNLERKDIRLRERVKKYVELSGKYAIRNERKLAKYRHMSEKYGVRINDADFNRYQKRIDSLNKQIEAVNTKITSNLVKAEELKSHKNSTPELKLYGGNKKLMTILTEKEWDADKLAEYAEVAAAMGKLKKKDMLIIGAAAEVHDMLKDGAKLLLEENAYQRYIKIQDSNLSKMAVIEQTLLAEPWSHPEQNVLPKPKEAEAPQRYGRRKTDRNFEELSKRAEDLERRAKEEPAATEPEPDIDLFDDLWDNNPETEETKPEVKTEPEKQKEPERKEEPAPEKKPEKDKEPVRKSELEHTTDFASYRQAIFAHINSPKHILSPEQIGAACDVALKYGIDVGKYKGLDTLSPECIERVGKTTYNYCKNVMKDDSQSNNIFIEFATAQKYMQNEFNDLADDVQKGTHIDHREVIELINESLRQQELASPGEHDKEEEFKRNMGFGNPANPEKPAKVWTESELQAGFKRFNEIMVLANKQPIDSPLHITGRDPDGNDYDYTLTKVQNERGRGVIQLTDNIGGTSYTETKNDDKAAIMQHIMCSGIDYQTVKAQNPNMQTKWTKAPDRNKTEQEHKPEGDAR